MSFDDMPEMPPMFLPGAADYAARILAGSKEVAARYPTVMDVAYGENYWQKVDFYLPDDVGAGDLPVLCYIHGGAFRNGFKEWMGFVAPPFLNLPAIFVSFSYRLVPTVTQPRVVDDCFDALKLVYDRVADYGGSPNRIFVAGHSAGANLCAMLALHREQSTQRGMPADVVKGCFPSGGTYDVRRENAAPGSVLARSYEGRFDSDEEAAYCSPVLFTADNTTPFLVAWGGEDLALAQESSGKLVAALKQESGVVEQHVWPGLDHFAANEAQANPNDPWTVTALKWLASPPAA
jgi:arylformamidase